MVDPSCSRRSKNSTLQQIVFIKQRRMGGRFRINTMIIRVEGRLTIDASFGIRQQQTEDKESIARPKV